MSSGTRSGAAARGKARRPLTSDEPAPPGYGTVRVASIATAVKALKSASSRLRQYETDNLRLVEQNGELRRRLEKTLSLDVGSPTFEGGLGGRTALEQYRNTNVGKFIQHVNEVGSFALSRGPDVAQFFAGSLLLADLEVLWAAPALTVDEARRRALVEHMLSDHGFLESISGTEEWNEKARRDLISLVLRSGVDTTSQELLRRSGEMPRQKAAVQDDDE